MAFSRFDDRAATWPGLANRHKADDACLDRHDLPDDAGFSFASRR
jgi:hypothetical protein